MLRTITLAATAAAILAAAPAGAAVVDVNAINGVGATLMLDAGTYDLAVIGTAGGGAYDAWNAWSNVSGCDPSGANCADGWLHHFAVDLGSGHVDRFQLLTYPRPVFATPALALAAAQTGPLSVSRDGAAFVESSQFTVATAGAVRFYIADSRYDDNLGGVSLNVTPVSAGVPEPATWALMIAGFAASGGALRRRRPAASQGVQ